MRFCEERNLHINHWGLFDFPRDQFDWNWLKEKDFAWILSRYTTARYDYWYIVKPSDYQDARREIY